MTRMIDANPIKILFASGLLITAGTQLLARFVHIPDFINGSCLGLGIGIEIMALVTLKKFKAAK